MFQVVFRAEEAAIAFTDVLITDQSVGMALPVVDGYLVDLNRVVAPYDLGDELRRAERRLAGRSPRSPHPPGRRARLRAGCAR